MSLCKFIMAFNCQDNRRDYMDECIGAFGVFRVLFEQNRERGVIHFIRKTRPEYSYRNRVIIKYKLYEKTRKRRAAKESKRAAA